MSFHRLFLLTGSLLAAVASFPVNQTHGCCPAPRQGSVVVNADQTVIIIWDSKKQMQHFIRQASFAGTDADFGFLIPSPTEPELDESGNDAFPFLQRLTAPEVVKKRRPDPGCGCGNKSAPLENVRTERVIVLQKKQVAGFHAVVLEASSADALVKWLKDHGYAYSPQIEAWAKPYVEQGWKITALKVADAENKSAANHSAPGPHRSVQAAALRMSFKTERPLFPYREPDYGDQPRSINKTSRLLRIYFLAESGYAGILTKDHPWTGQVAWAGPITTEQKNELLKLLKLPADTGPANWWLTEYEDRWPYKVAPADLVFTQAPDLGPVRRPPIVEYVGRSPASDPVSYALAGGIVYLWMRRQWRRWVGRRSRNSQLQSDSESSVANSAGASREDNQAS